ncbi:MAG: hypothetical protein ACI4QW_03700 [Clostridia bacterium]
MTIINCSKPCKFQTDGKCCCDSVMIPLSEQSEAGDSECPYQTPPLPQA